MDSADPTVARKTALANLFAKVEDQCEQFDRDRTREFEFNLCFQGSAEELGEWVYGKSNTGFESMESLRMKLFMHLGVNDFRTGKVCGPTPAGPNCNLISRLLQIYFPYVFSVQAGIVTSAKWAEDLFRAYPELYRLWCGPTELCGTRDQPNLRRTFSREFLSHWPCMCDHQTYGSVLCLVADAAELLGDKLSVGELECLARFVGKPTFRTPAKTPSEVRHELYAMSRSTRTDDSYALEFLSPVYGYYARRLETEKMSASIFSERLNCRPLERYLAAVSAEVHEIAAGQHWTLDGIVLTPALITHLAKVIDDAVPAF